jgi:hypothetical protein
MNEATMEWLTAAECALRTGLTVRALRVYEGYGLITQGVRRLAGVATAPRSCSSSMKSACSKSSV